MHPGVSVLFSYYPAARSEVECRACTREMHRLHLSTSPFLSFPFSYEHSCLSPCTRFFVHLYVQLFPSSGTQLPLGYDFFSLSLSFSLFLSRHLFLRFSTGLFPLSVARLVELFFVCRASPLYRCYAPTTASGVPTGERVTTFAPNYDCSCTKRSSFIARYSESHGTPCCVRLTRIKPYVSDLHALPLVTRGANRTRLFEINILVPLRGGRPVARSMPASAVASRREALIIFVR